MWMTALSETVQVSYYQSMGDEDVLTGYNECPEGLYFIPFAGMTLPWLPRPKGAPWLLEPEFDPRIVSGVADPDGL